MKQNVTTVNLFCFLFLTSPQCKNNHKLIKEKRSTYGYCVHVVVYLSLRWEVFNQYYFFVFARFVLWVLLPAKGKRRQQGMEIVLFTSCFS